MDLLSPNAGTIFWTVVTFVLLLLILKKFAWGPILKGLEDRENRIKSAVYQAEHDQKEAEKHLEEQKRIIGEANKESVKLLNDSKETAEHTRKEIVEQARSEAERMLERAKQEIDLSKEAAIADVKKYAVDISLLAAQKVVGETLSEKQQINLIEKYINELSQTT
ncbi:F0F1 ATP synthase subunit B [candidate division KSB1 bacterium]|nr:F0F1 ATP synthase subunit B [candidate division KSB1 bacterium]MBL7093116.1 F0F1 ATP synthase subunit B [candidate division KSB1 bacterium]